MQHRSGFYKRLYKENAKALQHQRRSIVEQELTTCEEKDVSSNDTDVLLAFCTGDDQVDGASGIKNSLKETAIFTELRYKVTALSFEF